MAWNLDVDANKWTETDGAGQAPDVDEADKPKRGRPKKQDG